MPATYDLALWRGNNPPVIWRFKNSDGTLFEITDERFLLTVFVRGRQMLLKDSNEADPAFLLDTDEAILTWQPTVDETRALPLGRIAKYELERWKDDVQATDLKGQLIVSGGSNVDVIDV